MGRRKGDAAGVMDVAGVMNAAGVMTNGDEARLQTAVKVEGWRRL